MIELSFPCGPVRAVRAVLLLAALSSGCSGLQPLDPLLTAKEEVGVHAREAYRLKEAKDYPGALREFNLALGLLPVPAPLDLWRYQLTNYHEARGEVHLALGDPDRAAADFQESIRSSVPGSESMERRKKLLAGVSRSLLDAEVAAAESRVKREPASAEALLGRASLLMLRRGPDDEKRARADALRAAEIDPESPRPQWALGHLAFQRGAIAEAKSKYLAAEAKYPFGSEVALLRLGLIAEGDKDVDLAVSRYAQALEAGEKRSSDLKKKFGGPEVLGPERRAQCHERRGRIRFAQGMAKQGDRGLLQTALRDFEGAFALDPEHVDVCYFRMKILFLTENMGSVKSAGADLSKALKARPDPAWNRDHEVITMRGVAAFRSQDWKQVEHSMAALTDGMYKRCGEAWYLRAIAAEHLGNYIWAPRYLAQARKLNPTLPPVPLPKTEEYHRQIAAAEEGARRVQATQEAEFLREQRERQRAKDEIAKYDIDKVLNSGMGNFGDDNRRLGEELDRHMREERAYQDKVRDAWARARTTEQLRDNLRLLDSQRPR